MGKILDIWRDLSFKINVCWLLRQNATKYDNAGMAELADAQQHPINVDFIGFFYASNVSIFSGIFTETGFIKSGRTEINGLC